MISLLTDYRQGCCDDMDYIPRMWENCEMHGNFLHLGKAAEILMDRGIYQVILFPEPDDNDQGYIDVRPSFMPLPARNSSSIYPPGIIRISDKLLSHAGLSGKNEAFVVRYFKVIEIWNNERFNEPVRTSHYSRFLNSPEFEREVIIPYNL